MRNHCIAELLRSESNDVQAGNLLEVFCVEGHHIEVQMEGCGANEQVFRRDALPALIPSGPVCWLAITDNLFQVCGKICIHHGFVTKFFRMGFSQRDRF